MSKIWVGIQKRYRLLAAAFLMVGVGSLVTIGVMAAIPSTNGVISGCYRTNGGSLRVIDSPTQTCNSNEAAISWNEATPGQFVKNLVGADFSHASLQYRNFYGLDMHGSNFTGAILTGSDLRGANLSGTVFDAGLNKVNASGANFSNASLRADAIDANFQNANFTGASILNLNGGNYQGANFTNTDFAAGGGEAYFINANLSTVDFRSSLFSGRLGFSASNLKDTNFSGLTLNNIHFVNVDVSNANFSNVVFVPGSMRGVFVDGTIAANTNFSNAQFNDMSFDGTNLSTADLSGTTWSNVICPDETNSDNNGNTCVGHLVP